MDQILDAIKCVNCLKFLSSPVFLPCGHCICRDHIDQASRCVKCKNCDLEQSNCSLNAVKALEQIIAAQIGSLDFGKTHQEAKKSCDELSECIDRVDAALKDPANYIYELFSELRRRVDLEYEECKLKFEQNVQKLRIELDRVEEECQQKLKSSNDLGLKEMENLKEEAQRELNSYLNALNELKFDEDKWKNIQMKCNKQKNIINEKLFKFGSSLIMDKFDSESFTVS